MTSLIYSLNHHQMQTNFLISFDFLMETNKIEKDQSCSYSNAIVNLKVLIKLIIYFRSEDFLIELMNFNLRIYHRYWNNH